MTKTPKNGSASSTPTPGGGGGGGNPGSVGPGGGAPPSVGSTKSEPGEAGNLDSNSTTSHENPGGRSGTPHSLPGENANNSSGNKADVSGDPESTNATSNTLNGGSTDGLLCDNGLENNPAGGNSASAGGGSNSARGTPDNNSNEHGGNPGSVGGAQIKSEVDVKPSVTSNCSTPLQSTSNNPLPSDMDGILDGFDSKDGGKLSQYHIVLARKFKKRTGKKLVK